MAWRGAGLGSVNGGACVRSRAAPVLRRWCCSWLSVMNGSRKGKGIPACGSLACFLHEASMREPCLPRRPGHSPVLGLWVRGLLAWTQLPAVCWAEAWAFLGLFSEHPRCCF